MAKRECIPFTHKGWMGSVELLDGVVSHVTWRNVTAPIESCSPELRLSIDKALEDSKPLDTPFRRLGRLEEQVREMGLALQQLGAHVDMLMGGAIRAE